ncbi:MAG: hypothetical protein AVDCRST_MAG32-3108, partial [uncultured Nocardioides sp.]
ERDHARRDDRRPSPSPGRRPPHRCGGPCGRRLPGSGDGRRGRRRGCRLLAVGPVLGPGPVHEPALGPARFAKPRHRHGAGRRMGGVLPRRGSRMGAHLDDVARAVPALLPAAGLRRHRRTAAAGRAGRAHPPQAARPV